MSWTKMFFSQVMYEKFSEQLHYLISFCVADFHYFTSELLKYLICCIINIICVNIKKRKMHTYVCIIMHLSVCVHSCVKKIKIQWTRSNHCNALCLFLWTFLSVRAFFYSRIHQYWLATGGRTSENSPRTFRMSVRKKQESLNINEM